MKRSGDIFNTESNESHHTGPVECLGLIFADDEERREFFLEKLREKLKDPEFRKIEGFPVGEDEDILALSDPPYYTACPNPFIEDFIKHYGKPYDPVIDDYQREPFAADVSEGKNDPIYNAHSYHTKVPHKAIMRYILHYTEPGDIVFDGFCGTGMTGIAAQCCADTLLVEGLGKRNAGARIPIIAELSAAASFIAGTLNSAIIDEEKINSFNKIVIDVENKLSWVYKVNKHKCNLQKLNYVVWSEVYLCPNCGADLVYFENSVSKATNLKGSDLQCSECKITVPKRRLERLFVTVYDQAINKVLKQVKYKPIFIVCNEKGNNSKKIPDEFDINLINEVNNSEIIEWFPIDKIPKLERYYKDGLQLINIDHVHQFYTKRNLLCAANIWSSIYDNTHKFIFTSFCDRHIVRRNRWLTTGPTRPLNNTLYFPPLFAEINVFNIAKRKAKDLWRSLPQMRVRSRIAITTTQSSTSIDQIPDSAVDYVFTDPPFGWNIAYSELNFVWESWLKVKTNDAEEVIVNNQAKKYIDDYRKLMSRCFAENYRILKPNRWMTVVFHNSSDMVWHSIQEALSNAGFVVADVRILDKKQGSLNQDYYRAGTVKQDLIISVYKPHSGLEERFKLTAGTEEGVWDFARTHLQQLPVFVSKDGQVEVVAERQHHLLFDRMMAFHVQRGVKVPLSAADFYAGLEQRFPQRDGMYFLPEQVPEYDRKRMTAREVLQLDLFVSDEASAIQWLKQQLTRKPQTFQDIHPQFLKELGGWLKHEKALELSDLLRENYLIYDGSGDVPSQIHSYLSSNFKELRNLTKDDPALKAKAKDRWYVPDPNRAGDLEKLRERALMREFEEYREAKQKSLKVFRLEAVRAGFKKAWQERDYATIIAVAAKIPDKILQEDPKLLMWYDQALTRTGEQA